MRTCFLKTTAPFFKSDLHYATVALHSTSMVLRLVLSKNTTHNRRTVRKFFNLLNADLDRFKPRLWYAYT